MVFQGEKLGPNECNRRTRSGSAASADLARMSRHIPPKQTRRIHFMVIPPVLAKRRERILAHAPAKLYRNRTRMSCVVDLDQPDVRFGAEVSPLSRHVRSTLNSGHAG